jgi:hypothetical protein
MTDISGVTRSIMLWVPDYMDPRTKTMRIIRTMIDHFKIKRIDTTDYHGRFGEFYGKHIRNIGTGNSDFCSKGTLGVHSGYITANSDKDTFVTLLSIDTNDLKGGKIVRVNALITFRWSEKADAIKIQTLCADQRVKSTGEGTKLLNFVKTTAAHMGIHKIYLNPVENAVPYYYKQQFRNAVRGDKILDSSDTISYGSSMSTPNSSKIRAAVKQSVDAVHSLLERKKVASSSSPHTKYVNNLVAKTRIVRALKKRSKKHTGKPGKSRKHSKKQSSSPPMIFNSRAKKNWGKLKSAFPAITHKRHGTSRLSVKAASPRQDIITTQPRVEKSRDGYIRERIDQYIRGLSAGRRKHMSYSHIYEMFRDSAIELTADEVKEIDKYLESAYGLEDSS